VIPRLLTVWYAVRSSLWALPLAMVIAAAALAYATLTIRLDLGGEKVWFLFSGSGSQAPQFLSSLMTAMITMATLAISITMVVLTLAAQQLGPRLIRNFMRNRRTQAALGLFIGTVVYLLLVLRSAYGDRNDVPNLAVTGGTLLVLICVITLLLFVHHLARSIIADNIIDDVGRELDGNIARLLPEKNDEEPASPPARKGKEKPVQLAYGGYVQAIDYQSIADAAAEADAVVALTLRAGHHAITGEIAAVITPAERAGDALCETIRDGVVIGAERTTVQDLEFSVRQMVEVALRALSPGINDVYTALAVINRLTLSIRNMMARGEPQSVWCDTEGTPRVTGPVSTFEGVTDAAFNQIRQSAFGKPAVLIHLTENLGQLLQQAGDAHRSALEKHLALVLAAGRRTIEDEADLNALEARARDARKETGASAEAGTDD